MLGTSAVAQLTAFGREPVSLQVVGLALLAAGLIVLVGGPGAGSIALCAAAAVVPGIGQGLAFSGSALEIGTTAPPDRRGNVMSLYFLTIYVGVSAAVITLGLVASTTGLLAAVESFSVVVAVVCLAMIAWHTLSEKAPRKR